LPPNTRKRGEWYHLDATIDGLRYRQPLNTKDWRQAGTLAKDRIGEIKAGKVASPGGQAFSRLSFQEAATTYLAERKGKVADRTIQFETERLRPLKRHFGSKSLRTFKATDVAAYQQTRVKVVAGRTVNMETSVLRRILKKAKLFAVLADYPTPFPEHEREVGRALPADEKLQRSLGSRPTGLICGLPNQ
jgi:hypothetical protein